MTAIEDVDAFIRIVKTHDGIVNYHEDPPDAALIEEAERVLGVSFPPSDRHFLSELGGCDIEGEEFYGLFRRRDDPQQIMGTVSFSLRERQDSQMPTAMLVLQYDGMGGIYVLDTAQPNEAGEAPVLVYLPPWVTDGRPLERIAPNFGAFALTKTRRAITA
ncbi:SMI1/KNR4 family protein [Actinospica durhamensis]|uniref:SMI1/KNR4 family protein n=1 Tax=Actinospica durhamensis TaxID=1508375 RepID=A0A941EYB6_9ACTN|nr:SMI1/KNR4 family protein [Actinospica durhamensis]MBR7839316.1 SMI1/KNR4 family protein [Actinospica durhamensis]